MLYRAQIMLLDEPTNHLDVKNVAWLVNYLTNLTEVTSVIVSHDSTFLDNVCQSIVHYENRKLRIYKVGIGISHVSFCFLLPCSFRCSCCAPAVHAQAAWLISCVKIARQSAPADLA